MRGAFGSAADAPRVALLCLCHDLAETRTGDHNYVNKKYVSAKEEEAVADLAGGLPFAGELSCDCLDDLNGGAYRCGQVYGIHIAVAGAHFYHQGSANLIDDAIRHHDVDYFLAGITGRGFTPDYTAWILRRLSPRVVVAHHHDDFFRPLDQPMRLSFNVDFAGFLEEVAAVSREFEVRCLDLLQTVGG